MEEYSEEEEEEEEDSESEDTSQQQQQQQLSEEALAETGSSTATSQAQQQQQSAQAVPATQIQAPPMPGPPPLGPPPAPPLRPPGPPTGLPPGPPPGEYLIYSALRDAGSQAVWEFGSCRMCYRWSIHTQLLRPGCHQSTSSLLYLLLRHQAPVAVSFLMVVFIRASTGRQRQSQWMKWNKRADTYF